MYDERIFFMGVMLIVLILIGVFWQADNTLKETREQEINLITEKASALEQHKFMLKEMDSNTLISGNVQGSYLLIAGSIYGNIGEGNYINLVYFDDDTILDASNGVYKFINFNMVNIEIVTIPKNETPYYKYIGNEYMWCEWGEECKYKIKTGTPRLFLPEGWEILNLDKK